MRTQITEFTRRLYAAHHKVAEVQNGCKRLACPLHLRVSEAQRLHNINATFYASRIVRAVTSHWPYDHGLGHHLEVLLVVHARDGRTP